MKTIKQSYLTGVEDVDKYFVENYDLIELLEFPDGYQRWFVYLDEHLSQQQFKDYIENNYPLGYKDYIKFTYNTRTDYAILTLTKKLIANHIWIEQIFETIHSGKSPFGDGNDRMFLKKILEVTDDEAIIRHLINHKYLTISNLAKKKLKTL